MNVLEKVIEMLAEQLDCETSTLNAETELSTLGIDSLDVMQLLMTVEEEFDTEIEIGENKVAVIGDLVKLIEEKI